jgi:hypothetical protein
MIRAIHFRALNNERAGYFEQKVTQKEDACPSADYGVRKTEVTFHLKLGDGNIGSIQESNQEQKYQKW